MDSGIFFSFILGSESFWNVGCEIPPLTDKDEDEVFAQDSSDDIDTTDEFSIALSLSFTSSFSLSFAASFSFAVSIILLEVT